MMTQTTQFKQRVKKLSFIPVVLVVFGLVGCAQDSDSTPAIVSSDPGPGSSYQFFEIVEAGGQLPAPRPHPSNNGFMSNIIQAPDTLLFEIHIGAHVFPVLTANQNGQSPFNQVPPGTYDVTLVLPDGYSVADAQCAWQDLDGTFYSLGTWDGIDTYENVTITEGVAHMCEWLLEPGA